MITLHPTRGVNPKLTYCPRCGGEANELLLIGNREYIRKCRGCGQMLIGFATMEACPGCHDRGPHEVYKRIGEHDKLPASQPCDACKEEMKQHAEIVANGGVYWQCDECGRRGVIKAESPMSAAVRNQMKIEAPEPCGIKFEKCKSHTA